jgi:hypothetical protein
MSPHINLNFKIAMSRVRSRWLKSNLPLNLEEQLIQIKTLEEFRWKRIPKARINIQYLLLPRQIMTLYKVADIKS